MSAIHTAPVAVRNIKSTKIIIIISCARVTTYAQTADFTSVKMSKTSKNPLHHVIQATASEGPAQGPYMYVAAIDFYNTNGFMVLSPVNHATLSTTRTSPEAKISFRSDRRYQRAKSTILQAMRDGLSGNIFLHFLP